MANQNFNTASSTCQQSLPFETSLKWCSQGKHFVPRDGFSLLSEAKDGLQYTCKECANALSKMYYEKHRERINARMRDYDRRHREEKKQYRLRTEEMNKTRSQVYYLNNKAQIDHQNREWYWADPIRARERSRKRYRENKVTYFHYARNRRAQKRAATGSFSFEQWIAKCAYWGWRCYLCGSQLTPETVTADHRIPLSRGGSNWIANIAPACNSCNCSKQSLTEFEYRATRQSAFLRLRNETAY